MKNDGAQFSRKNPDHLIMIKTGLFRRFLIFLFQKKSRNMLSRVNILAKCPLRVRKRSFSKNREELNLNTKKENLKSSLFWTIQPFFPLFVFRFSHDIFSHL